MKNNDRVQSTHWVDSLTRWHGTARESACLVTFFVERRPEPHEPSGTTVSSVHLFTITGGACVILPRRPLRSQHQYAD